MSSRIESREIPYLIKSKNFKELLNALTSVYGPEVWDSAKKALVELGEESFDFLYKFVEEMLESDTEEYDEWKKFRESVEILGLIGNKKAKGLLLRVLENNNVYNCRIAVGALVKLGYVLEEDQLIGEFDNEKKTKIDVALRFLSYYGSKKSFDAVISLLDEREIFIRQSVFVALGDILEREKEEFSEIRDLIMNHLEKGDDNKVQNAAILVLRNFKDEKTRNELIDKFGSEGYGSFKAIIKTLGLMGTKESLETLLEYIKEKSWEYNDLKESLLNLGEDRKEDIALMMKKTLQRDDIYIAQVLADVLAEYGDERSIIPLIEIGNKIEWGFYDSGIDKILIKIGKKYPEIIIRRLNIEEDIWLKSDIVHILGEISDIKALESILKNFQLLNETKRDFEISISFLYSLTNFTLDSRAVYPLLTFIHAWPDPFMGSSETTGIILQIFNDLGEEAIPELIKALNSEDEAIRYMVICIVQQCEFEIPNKDLVAAFLVEEELKMGFLATIDFTKLDDELTNSLIQPLFSLLKEEDSDIVLERLSELNISGTAVPLLIPMLEEEDLLVRATIMRFLENIYLDESSLPLMFDLFSEDIGRNNFLNNFIKKRSRISDVSLNFLTEQLKSDNVHKSRAAVLALKNSNFDEKETILTNFLEENPTEELKYLIELETTEIDYVGRLSNKIKNCANEERKKELLEEQIYWSHFDRDLIMEFSYSLIKKEQTWIVEPLYRELKRQCIYWIDEDNFFRNLIDNLSVFGDKSMTDTIVQATHIFIQNSDWSGRKEAMWLRQWISEILFKIKNFITFESVEKVLSYFIRIDSDIMAGPYIEMLGKLKEERSKHLLREILSKWRWMFGPILAAHALGELKDSGAVEKLIENTRKDNTNDLRSACIWALGEIGDVKAQLSLERYINDDDEEIRHRVEEALQKLKKNIAPLIDNLKETDDNKRKKAVESLGILGDEKAKNPLFELLKKEEKDEIRESIILTLGKLGDIRIFNLEILSF